MTALLFAVFAASVLGSLHCVGMCGPFAAFAIGIEGERAPGERAWVQHVLYHGARLVVYVVMGVVAGLMGSAFDVAGGLLGVQRAAVLMAGATLTVFGLIAVLRFNGVRVPTAGAPRWLRSALAGVSRFAMARPPAARSALTGLATALLPCGWLYAFVLVAAGTASAGFGALVMASFWLGTVPALAAVGVGVRGAGGLIRRLGRRAPVLAALAVTLVGLWMVMDRGVAAAADEGVAGGVSSVPGPTALMERVSALRRGEYGPTCHDGD